MNGRDSVQEPCYHVSPAARAQEELLLWETRWSQHQRDDRRPGFEFQSQLYQFYPKLL